MKLFKVYKEMFKKNKYRVSIDLSGVSPTQVIKEGDEISVDNGIEKIKGVFIKQVGRSFFGSHGEYRTKAGEMRIYDEFVHTIKKL